MFWSPDSRSYRSVADWVLGNGVSTNALIIPVLYPLIIAIGRLIDSNFGIWGLQFIMWIISGLILYRILKIATRNYYLTVLGLIIYTGNVTLILLTLHALTEVTAIFLISVLIAWIINIKDIEQNHYWSLVLFILSLLVLIKPIFISVWLILLIYQMVTFIYYRINRQINWKYLGFLVIAILPILVQVSLMKITFNQFTISNIGAFTLKKYLFARVYADINLISVEQARNDTVLYSQNEIYMYLMAHFNTTIESYVKNIAKNIISNSNFVNFPRPNNYLFVYMRLVNIGYFFIHVMMVPISIIVSIQLFRKRLWNEFIIILSLMLLLFVIFSSSGITFSQGDRILLPSLPIWIILYCTVFSRSFISAKEKTMHARMR